ncbi:YmaF family protein [Brevibacillus choshinensis]|uniref:YmaF family protein n=1 Tax=Brevibacillus choshinensis TaxID=54911 RepID=UPI003D187B7A
MHEFTGSTKFAEEGDERHNHRFAGVTGKAIRRGNSHIHIIRTKADFFDHFHVFNFATLIQNRSSKTKRLSERKASASRAS